MTAKFGKLILVTPDQPGQEFILTQPLTTLGSAETNDIVIKQAKLSRAHARIECSEKGCMIFDLESSAGTQVNNRRIKQSNLVSGDILKLGEAELRFEAEPVPAEADDATVLDVAVFAEGDPEQVEAAKPSPKQARNALVKLQAGKDKPPFFCVTARYSDLPLFRNLALHLGPGQSFYALQPPQPATDSPVLTNLEALAAHYVEEVRRTQPTGPYYVGGYNIGGLVAFEMAQQLQAGGAEVALLALIDTPYLERNPLPYWSYRSAQKTNEALFQPLQKWAPSLVQQVEKSTQSVLNTLQNKPFPPVVGQVAQQMEENYQTFQETLEDEGYQATVKVTRNYRPKAYSGKVTLLLAAQSPVRYSDALWQWHRVAPNGLEVHTVPGSYIGILKEPQVQKLASQLKAYLAH